MTKSSAVEFFNFRANIYTSDFGTGFSSLFAMLCALIKLGAQNIYLVGFDGHVQVPGQVYYGQEKMCSDNYKTRAMSIAKDTKMMMIFFWEYIEYALNESRYSIIIKNLTGSTLRCFDLIEISEMARRSGEGLCDPTTEQRKYSHDNPIVEVRVSKPFLSPTFGDVNEGQILKVAKRKADIFVRNGMGKIVEKLKEAKDPCAAAKNKFYKRKARRKPQFKLVNSYYTMDHPKLLESIKNFTNRRYDETQY